jgi:hypothetical protein
VATLEDAAQELVDKLEELDGDCKAAQEAFASHLEDLAALDANLARDWDGLTETVSAFLQAVQEQSSLLAADGTEAANELGSVRSEVESVQAQAEAEIAGSREEVAALGEHLRSLEPAIEPLVATGAEAPLVALREQAARVREQLEEALTEAGEFLSDVATELATVAQDVEERSQALRAHIAEECTEQLQTGFDTWLGHVEELEGLVREKLDELPQNAREVVEYAMTECVAGHEEELDRVLAVMPQIDQALEELRSAVDETATDVGEEALGALDDRLGTLTQSITRTGEALDAVREVLASYTFVTI